jgi:hypothetical protein
MDKAIVVRGCLSDPKHIELDEPVTELSGPVEVVVRQAALSQEGQDLLELLSRLPPGKRSREDIDRQVQAEKASWGNR